jgi:hypothetical protein
MVIASYIHNVTHKLLFFRQYLIILAFYKYSEGARVVGVANKLQAGQSRVQIPVGARGFSRLHNVQPDTWVNPVGEAELYLNSHQCACMAWTGKKFFFCLFKCCVNFCHTELLCGSLDPCFLAVFTWRNPQNDFSHIARLLSIAFICTRSAVYTQYIAPLEQHCQNSKNTTFQERGKATGWDNAFTSKE